MFFELKLGNIEEFHRQEKADAIMQFVSWLPFCNVRTKIVKLCFYPLPILSI